MIANPILLDLSARNVKLVGQVPIVTLILMSVQNHPRVRMEVSAKTVLGVTLVIVLGILEHNVKLVSC